MQNPRNKKVSLADLAVLIAHVYQAAQDPDVGYVDANRTLTELLQHLAPFVWVDASALESALAHANFLDESGKFLDWRGNSFDQLASRVAAPLKFDKEYNYFTEKK